MKADGLSESDSGYSAVSGVARPPQPGPAPGDRQCEYEGCREWFSPARSDARYHSAACRALASRNRNETKRNTPEAAAEVNAAPAGNALTCWNPLTPEQPPDAWSVTSEPCPQCGEMLLTRGRLTMRLCTRCGKGPIPAGVLAPWLRGPDQPRAVRSRAEVDAESRALAVRRGRMARQLAALLDRDLADESRDLVEWYLAEVRKAGSMLRLDQLAEDFAAETIRPRRWWHTDPPEVRELASAGPDRDGGAEEVWEAELVEDGEDQAAAAVSYRPAAIAGPAAAVGELAAGRHAAVELAPHQWPHGWSMSAPALAGGCQVRQLAEGQCPGPGEHRVPLAAVCGRHYRLLQAHQEGS
jgi:hypothetical protein